MVDAGAELGLSRETATELTLQTAYGAALMAQKSDDGPGQLRENVTSPGGTTAAALAVMQRCRPARHRRPRASPPQTPERQSSPASLERSP